MTFPAKISVTPADVVVDSEFSINRKDFGIVYAGKADDLIRDDVVIKLDLKAPRKHNVLPVKTERGKNSFLSLFLHSASLREVSL